MLTFNEWLIKTKRKKKNERPASQSNREIGAENKQGQADRLNQEIELERVSYFPEPK